MNLSLSDFRAIVALAEELHFSRAARRLRVAQPHLSAQIRRIEASVGGPLFARRPRVAATPAGQEMIDAARRVLAEVDAAVERVRLTAAGAAGTVSVGFASTTMLTEIPALLAEFGREHPGVSLRLREMHSAPQVAALGTGLIDVGFTREIPTSTRLASEVVVREPFMVVLPEHHRLAKASESSLAELAAEAFVLFRREIAPSLYDQIVSICVAAGFAPRIVQEADEWHTIFAFVRSNFGVSISPASLRRLTWPGIVVRELSETPVRATVAICWSPARLSPAATVFLDFVRRRMRTGAGSAGPLPGRLGDGVKR